MTRTIKKLTGEQVTADHVRTVNRDANGTVEIFRLTDGELVVARTEKGENLPKIDPTRKAADFGTGGTH